MTEATLNGRQVLVVDAHVDWYDSDQVRVEGEGLGGAPVSEVVRVPPAERLGRGWRAVLRARGFSRSTIRWLARNARRSHMHTGSWPGIWITRLAKTATGFRHVTKISVPCAVTGGCGSFMVGFA